MNVEARAYGLKETIVNVVGEKTLIAYRKETVVPGIEVLKKPSHICSRVRRVEQICVVCISNEE
jgi:hypothetical protein